MKRLLCAGLFLILVTGGYGQIADENKESSEKTFIGDQVEFTCKRPNTGEEIPLKTILPKSWKRDPAFGTVVYQPANSDDYYEPPSIEHQVKCEGECAANAIPGNIEGYIERLKEGWKTLSTGDAELDKLGTNVEIIKEECSKGQWLFEVKLTYPRGVSSAMYPHRYWIYRFIHNAQDSFFILIKGKVPVNLADQFLPDVYMSCLSTVKL
ncbi:hypothetical protein KAR48_09035 [bacterium]|nr:hypothetical protein [bacterium]